MNDTDDAADSLPQKKEDGVLEAWGSRAFLCDALGGFYALREQVMRELGAEFTADILYRAGFSASERLMSYVCAETHENGWESLNLALALLTEAGYGVLSLASVRPRSGEARITNENSLEGTIMSQEAGRAGFSCDYMRGILRGILHLLPHTEALPSGALECVEVACIANGDPNCRFIVASQEHLSLHGYRVGEGGYTSVRETLLRLNRQLEDVLEAAKRDTLTGLFNRAHFESALRHRIEYANRRTDTLAVAMIDIDGFKEVNDTRGHSMGDLALKQVGQLLEAHARETDIVARYGGDEFAWLMPGTSVEAALAVADRIRRRVQEEHGDADHPLTLSIGIAACPENATTLEELIDLADVAMYRAKGSGGNQVERYVATDVSNGSSPARRKVRRSKLLSSVAKPRPVDHGSLLGLIESEDHGQ